MKCGVIQVRSESTSELTYKCEQECEQMLKVRPQHRKQGNRIVRTVVQYVL